MALWPFRRKSRRKRSRVTTTDFDETRGRAKEPPAPPRSYTTPDTTMTGTTPEGGRKGRASPNKLQRRPRTYSFSPGRNDSINVGRKLSTKAKREPRLKQPATGAPPVGFGAEKIESGGPGGPNEYVFDRVPTLHNKRDGDHLPRKKSSKKRRRNDPEREAEIKAMSAFVPVRSATEDWTSGRPMKKDSKRIKTGFSLGFRGSGRHEWDKENRSSDISIPVAESIRSAMSSDSEHISYQVSALDALAPRPTLRYTISPAFGGSGDGPVIPARRSSQRGQRMLSMPIPEATLKAHKRIDDLADELSAGDLRELMERDQRRRQRKRERDAERLEQRLLRRAEKQRAQDAEARRDGKESPPNLERGVLGRESIGLGIEPASAIITSSKRRQPSKRRSHQLEGEGEGAEEGEEETPANPLAAFHRTTSIPLSPIEQHEADEPVTPLKSPKSRSSFLRPKFSRSKSPLDSEATKTEPSESLRKGSETSSSRGQLSWMSIFKWGLRNKRSSEGPSSFSNTSRDSMQTAQVPIQPVTTNFVPRRVSSGVPKRTMSRFREDLPELPLSPPDSRLQSPEAEAIPHTIAEASPDLNRGMTFTVPAQLGQYDTPTSEQRSMEAMRQTPSTFGHPDEPALPSPEPHTVSLASIDSEASWLSGRLSKKRVSSSVPQPAPVEIPRRTSELELEYDEHEPREHEEMSITEDDYLSRVATHSPVADRNRQSTVGEGRPSSDGEGEAHWGSVRGHHPTLVHSSTVGRMKSREGLLNTFGEAPEIVAGDEDGGEKEETSPISPTSDTSGASTEEAGAGIQRATSINLGKGHARHISAGSARLLAISPRSSVDVARRSMHSDDK
ncbi:hypothetical protein V8F20_010670 [Naviculisporaceae sp. PSN 640]